MRPGAVNDLRQRYAIVDSQDVLSVSLEPTQACSQQAHGLSCACWTLKQRILSVFASMDHLLDVLFLALVRFERKVNLEIRDLY